MRYYTEIDAVEELESVDMTDGIMLTGEDCLMRTEDQRLLVQSLLLDPPQAENDERLRLLQHRQTILWLEKIEGCASMQLCIRLPDRPVDAFLPDTQAEIARLSGYMSRPVDWVTGQVCAARNLNPDLSCRGCRMMISNELLFRALVRAILAAVKERGIRKLSFLLPFVSECREVSYLKGIITGYAAADGIETTIGIEIATPRAACIAGELAAHADAMVFNVEELVQLLYGMSRFDTRKVISCYLHENVFRHNPFVEFDEIGIGTLLMIALKQIRHVRPQMRLSAIGHCVLSEKGRKFCQDAGIDILIAQQHQFRAEHIPSSHNR